MDNYELAGKIIMGIYFIVLLLGAFTYKVKHPFKRLEKPKNLMKWKKTMKK